MKVVVVLPMKTFILMGNISAGFVMGVSVALMLNIKELLSQSTLEKTLNYFQLQNSLSAQSIPEHNIIVEIINDDVPHQNDSSDLSVIPQFFLNEDANLPGFIIEEPELFENSNTVEV